MWLAWFVGCSWVLPSVVTPGEAVDCAALVAKVDPARPIADVLALAVSARRTGARRAETRAWLTGRFAAAGLDSREAPFTIAGVSGTNVVAGGGRILVGAHYDSVGDTPGADDNASGVAVMLEVARVLGPAVTFVAFDAEEPHVAVVGADARNYAFGSQAFVDATPGAWELAVIIESVGFSCADCQRLPAGVPASFPRDSRGVYAIVAGERDWGRDVATFGAAGRTATAVTIPGTGRALPQSRFSDHAPFWDAGVPAMMVTDTALLRNPHYHEPTDVPATLDAALLADVARGVTAMVGAAAGRCGP